MSSSWWTGNVSFPNRQHCSVCEMPRRGWIYLRNDEDRTPLVPPIAICPICDWPADGGDGGPVSSLDRVKDIPT